MINAPASTVWVTPDLGVAIVPGDQEPWTETWYPPAAWAQYDKPCETCRGDRLAAMAGYAPAACPDCRDGRQVWQVQWPCPHDCERYGGKVPGHARGSNWPWVPCWCEGTGLLSARANLQVVPVVAGRPPYPDGCVIVGDCAVLLLDSLEQVLPLDPLPTPGRDFAVIFHKVAP